MILPPFVGAIGIRQIFGQYGALNALLQHLGLMAEGAAFDWLGANRFWGIVLLNALHLYPILYLNVLAALANVDPAMEEAAENLGCTGFRRFFKITLPLIRPGVFAGGTIIFIWSFTELGVPLIFDFTRVTPVQIFYGLKDIGGSPFPYALVAIMLISSVLLYAHRQGSLRSDRSRHDGQGHLHRWSQKPGTDARPDLQRRSSASSPSSPFCPISASSWLPSPTTGMARSFPSTSPFRTSTWPSVMT